MKKKAEEKDRKASEKKKTSKVSLLDGKRAMNVGISIGRIRFPYAEVRDKVVALEDSCFSVEQLQSLVDSLPTKEDEGVLRQYTGDRTVLGEAEKFMMEFLDVKDAKDRVNALIYMRQFHTRITDLKSDVKVIETACD